MTVQLGFASIVTAFDDKAIGTKVTDEIKFRHIMLEAIADYDKKAKDNPKDNGQWFIFLPKEVVFYVAGAGVGKRSNDENDYVLRSYRGRVDAYLKREKAEQSTGVAVVVYTRDAYLRNPDVQADPDELRRAAEFDASHYVVAILSFAGPPSVVSPYRFTANLAGANDDFVFNPSDMLNVETTATDDDHWLVVAD